MNFLQEGMLVAAAMLAGLVNSIAGGGTLFSFPALLWAGRDPILANATSTVALWPGSLAGAHGFREEIGSARRWLWILSIPSFAGGLAGAVLLLRTPSEAFERIVPFLILGATLLLAGQEVVTRSLGTLIHPDATPSRKAIAGAVSFQFLVAVYGGYFGAGIGILMLAALAILGFTDIHQMNGMKNLLALCINGVAAAWFVFTGSVLWFDVALMVAGAVAGGYLGPRIARRLGRKFVRSFVISVGFAMATTMLVREYVL